MGYQIAILPSLRTIQPQAWDALAKEDNPFVEYAFLRLLEESKSVGPRTGWEPAYVSVWKDKTLVGALPSYQKTDSYGEYIFDWRWADIALRFGLDYYPKITVAIPFTPATGPRLLLHPGEDPLAIQTLLLQGLYDLQAHTGASSIHILFCQDHEATWLAQEGFSRRATWQFHWRNHDYPHFDGFLAALRAQARKQIKRERRRIDEDGLTVEIRKGSELSADEWQTLYRLYMSTSARKWGSPYLTQAFFQEAKNALGDRALIAFARRAGAIVAGTLSFQKGQHLYGRYWGAFETHEGLHFELCYYRLVEYAIEHRLSLVEAGAQGEHKIKRGFLPVITHSAHTFAHPGLREAFDKTCLMEEAAMKQQILQAQEDGPFRTEALPPSPPLAGIPLPRPFAATSELPAPLGPPNPTL